MGRVCLRDQQRPGVVPSAVDLGGRLRLRGQDVLRERGPAADARPVPPRGQRHLGLRGSGQRRLALRLPLGRLFAGVGLVAVGGGCFL